MDDHQILEAWKTRDERACGEAMRMLMPRLMGYATRLLGNRSEAEEVVQEALVASFESVGRFEGRSSFVSWLFRITHNKAVDSLRLRSRFVPLNEEDPEGDSFDSRGHWAFKVVAWPKVDEHLDAHSLLQFVKDEMASLPATQREVLILCEIQGLSTEDVCTILEISPVNLRVSLHRARQALRKAIDRRFQGKERKS